jgi:hypothetical protein
MYLLVLEKIFNLNCILDDYYTVQIVEVNLLDDYVKVKDERNMHIIDVETLIVNLGRKLILVLKIWKKSYMNTLISYCS